MKDFALPGARAAFVGPDGLTQRPFYQWMLAVDRTVTDNTAGNSSADAAIKAIALKLGSPDGSVANIPKQGTPGTINGSGSIQVDGTLESGVVNLSLMYDTLFPGPSTFYGAGPDAKRGWFPVSGALADSVTIVVSTDTATGISSFDLKPTGVVAGVYGAGAQFLIVSVDDDGRIGAISTRPLIAGNGITLEVDPDTGAVTISVTDFNLNSRVTEDGNNRITRNGDFRASR